MWSVDNNKATNVITRLAEAVLESENLFEFIKKAYVVLNHTWLAILLTFFFMLFHLAMSFYGNLTTWLGFWLSSKP